MNPIEPPRHRGTEEKVIQVFKPGMAAMIFENPVTRTLAEGRAILVSKTDRPAFTDCATLENWRVRFANGGARTFERWVNAEDLEVSNDGA